MMPRAASLLVPALLALASCGKVPPEKMKADFEEAIETRFAQWNEDTVLAFGARTDREPDVARPGVCHRYKIVKIEMGEPSEKEPLKAEVVYTQDTFVRASAGTEGIPYRWDAGHEVTRTFSYVGRNAVEGGVSGRRILDRPSAMSEKPAEPAPEPEPATAPPESPPK